MPQSRLFQPLKVGRAELKSRIVMAPCTRFRADDSHAPLPIVAEYYGQRASVPGTLLIAEATLVSHRAGAWGNVPGIYTQEHIDAWRKVTDEVHRKSCFIYLQLWAHGRAADAVSAEKDGVVIKAPSPIPMDADSVIPQEMTINDIRGIIDDYVQGAKNAIAAGFDGIEFHGAHGFLIDQFLRASSNQRTDGYGGSIENRSRFTLEAVKAVADAIGADRTAIRFSPFAEVQGMNRDEPQFTHVIKVLNTFGLSYIHLVTARVAGPEDVPNPKSVRERIEDFFPLFDGPILVAGGFKPDSAKHLVDEEQPQRDILVVFGRYFISTPDLVFRVQKSIDPNPYIRDTFYLPKEPVGMTDYPFSEEFLASATKAM